MNKKNLLTLSVLSVLIFLASCSSPGKKTFAGTGIGAAAGAGIGAIFGKGKGAAIGASVGALLGGGVGNYLDRQAKELAAVAETERTPDGIRTKLKGDLLFDTNSYSLKTRALDQVREVGAIVTKYPKNIIKVVGYTDSTGSPTHNQKLSQQRADMVKSELIGKGFPSDRVQAVGMGETNFVGDNSTAGGRELNRRVEVLISVPQG